MYCYITVMQPLAYPDLYKHLFDSAPIGMALVSLSGTWLEVNDSMCEITGYSRPELLSKTVSEITYEDDRQLGIELLQSCMDGERCSYVTEKRYIRKDGSITWVSLHVSLLKENGENAFFVGHIIDINERKAIELIMTDKNKELETFNKLMVDRELRMIDLKKENENLQGKVVN